MKIQRSLSQQANRLLLLIGVLLTIGLFITVLQVVLGQAAVVLADEDEDDEVPTEGRGIPAEGRDRPNRRGGRPEDRDPEDRRGVQPPSGDPVEAPENGRIPAEIIASGSLVYLPSVFVAPPIPTLDSTKPNSNNRWIVNWLTENGDNITGFILEESQRADFSSDVVSYDLGIVNSQLITKPASPNNTYYYRVRSAIGNIYSEWSNTVIVHGAYHDDFSDPTTGWAARRMTFLEMTDVKYGKDAEAGNLLVLTFDRWDWVLGSPLRHAPAVPYEIEYRMRVHDPSNLVSGGAVLGGDWNGDACPEFGNVYQTDNCFNSFYNFNMIYFGPMKLLFEQVDRLDFCPNCGGSQLKRLGPTQVVENISGLENPANDWHTYRIEVQSDGMRFYVDDKFVRHFTDTTYINRPYFGVFTSTDEYNPSIYFYDYYSVTPMDN